MPLGTYRIAAVGTQVGIGVAGSVYLSVAAVGKGDGSLAAYCIANELICGELGRFLRLPIPPGGIVSSAHHSPMYASLDFNLAGVSLPPADPVVCVQHFPRLAAGVLLFDILIANSDRHRKNLSMQIAPPQLNVFDHSHALLGSEAGRGRQRLEALAGHLAVTGGTWTGGHRHCLLEAVNSDQHFAEWFARIAAIPNFFIDEICEDARAHGVTPDESETVRHFLKGRRDSFGDLIKSYRGDFPAITSWSIV